MADAENLSFPLLDAATACPVCQAERPQPLHVYPNPKRRIARAERLILTGCRVCGVAWSHPLPSEQEVEAWYAGTQGWEQRPGLRSHADRGDEAEAKLRRKLEAKRSTRERETELLLSTLGELPGSEPPTVLDFGCGIGAWLDAFAARGWVTSGIEPGPTARAITARRHRVIEAPPDEPEFDLVVVQHVFEHLRDPLGVARALAAAIRPGGRLFVSVPSFDRLPLHGKLGYTASGVHLFSYTAEAMTRMLALAGLRVTERLEGGGWEEGSQGPDVHLKVLARRDEAVGPVTGGDPLSPVRTALEARGRAGLAALAAAPPLVPPRGLARLSRRRQAKHQSVLTKRKRALHEPLELPLLDPPETCPCCSGEALKPLHVLRNPRRRIAPVGHLVVTGCRRCGIVFAHPLPTPAQVDAFYAGEAQGWEDRLDEHDDEHEAFMDRKHARYRRELELLGDSLGGAAGGGRRVLDFGCGLGAWLDVLAQAGWETEGLEPGAEQRTTTARRHRVIDAVPTEPRYDLIVLHHVLEHLRDPVAVLRELHAAARPGARLYASSPDFGRLAEHGKLGYVTSGVHVMSFTTAGLRSVLGLAGWVTEGALGGSAWDSLDARPGMRVRMVAVAGLPVVPPADPDPLRVAELALRGHAAARAAAPAPAASKSSLKAAARTLAAGATRRRP